MKLLKVSVPNFRNLYNVELTFEPSLTPSVFPIGSENGGGKSTLLQLIFVLLTCWKEEKKKYLINFMNSSQEINGTIAKITILYKGQEIEYEFIEICNKSLEDLEKTQPQYVEYVGLSYNAYEIQMKIKALRQFYLDRESESLSTRIIISIDGKEFDGKELRKIAERMESYATNLNIISDQIQSLKREINVLFSQVFFNTNNNLLQIDDMIICQTTFNDYDLAKEALDYASEHIYLATPPTQPYLFLERETKRQLLTDFGNYQTQINQLRQEFPNIYSYNQLSLTEILNSFKKAREKDFKQAIDTMEYGNSFQALVEDYHQFLGNDKYIVPNETLTSIMLRRHISETKFVELEPEDLSHGELKRLGLYSWIKYNNLNDSIILIDEIENGLHPDWQYNIVRDLAEWGKNQYLLATHSFYLCEALTPRHVKIIEPTLSNPYQDNDNSKS